MRADILLTVFAAASTTTITIAAANAHDVREIPVEFAVVNRNGSLVPCPSDGHAYTVRGEFVAPAEPASAALSAVAVYLHGGAGSEHWRFDAVPGLDTVEELARLGHASIALDMLGYGASDVPPGQYVCMGSVADTVHQVISALRAGTYLLGDRDGPPIGRVALGGLSAGAIAAWVEATSFHDVDALIPVGVAHIGANERAVTFGAILGRSVSECVLGRHEPKRPGASGGYTRIFRTEDEMAIVMYDSDPAVVRATFERGELDPCGMADSLAPAFLVTAPLMATLRMPVLGVIGDHDVVDPIGAEGERLLTTGNSDVSVAVMADTGHIPMTGRTAAVFRALLDGWLAARGF